MEPSLHDRSRSPWPTCVRTVELKIEVVEVDGVEPPSGMRRKLLNDRRATCRYYHGSQPMRPLRSPRVLHAQCPSEPHSWARSLVAGVEERSVDRGSGSRS